MDNSARVGLSAIVEYDYKAKEPDELDLVKGAIIINIKKQDIGWWEGTLASSGTTGMFPDNFVRLLNNDDEKVQVVLRNKSATIHRRCKVVYSYTQNNEDELSLEVGNIIEVLGEVEEGWWRGKIDDKIGVFPSNFVVPIETSPILINKKSTISSSSTSSSTTVTKKQETKQSSSLHSSREDLFSSSPSSSSNLDKDAPLLPPKPVREYCRVLFAYEPQNEDELELQVGEIITILSKELSDKGWWKGELRGKIGVFPDNFVQILSSEVSPSKDSSYPDRPPPGSSKVFIKKSGSGSSSQGSNRKDSFGSRDSLNDILSETGIVSGSVAAQRKSLENKTNDVSSNDNKVSRRSLESKTTEVRKSLENMDEKKTPPPVLTKKPIVPVKKQTSVTSVAGNLLSGLKQKVKSVENKLSSHDSMDGICSSKMNSQIPDTTEKGITGERLRRDESEFDNVERGSMLADMRAGRAKAPKRRPPSAAINVIGEGNNNSIYLNGGGAFTDPIMNDGRSEVSESEELAKPKPREWEKKKAPWMEELKASQAKKTSPNVEPRLSSERPPRSEQIETVSTKSISEKVEATKTITNSSNNITGGYSSSSNQQRKSVEVSSGESKISSNNYETKMKKEITTDMTKSMSAITSPKLLSSSNSDHSNMTVEDIKVRPTSLSIRNRSVSPVGKNIVGKSSSVDQPSSTSLLKPTSGGSSTSGTSAVSSQLTSVNHENVCSRVMELEQRIVKLEGVVQSQNRIIEELIRSLKEETDKVKGLRTELDKYAQCVTQV